MFSVNSKQLVTADPKIMHGAVCFCGTRIPVSVVLNNLAAGETAETVLHEYPSLEPEYIPAIIAYAAELSRKRILPVPDRAYEVRRHLWSVASRSLDCGERHPSRGWVGSSNHGVVRHVEVELGRALQRGACSDTKPSP